MDYWWEIWGIWRFGEIWGWMVPGLFDLGYLGLFHIVLTHLGFVLKVQFAPG